MAAVLGNCCHAKLQTYPRHIANVTGCSYQVFRKLSTEVKAL